MTIGKCIDEYWQSKRRQELVDQYWAETSYLGPQARKSIPKEIRKKHSKRWDEVIDIYNEEISPVEVSRCPICDEKLYYEMDALGLDSPWWNVGYPEEDKPKLQACSHFRILLGAIDFHGRDPVESHCHPNNRGRNIQPGPGVPFVVPHTLLSSPDMIAVISSFKSAPGDTYYPIAYFSKSPVSPGDLHQPWARETLKVYNGAGEHKGWTRANYKWDFDLQSWINKKKVAWINPGENELTTDGVCPYVNIQGIQKPQLIEQGLIKTLHLPDGA